MDDMTAQFENVLAEICREMRGVRDELAKFNRRMMEIIG
jgi:hypothetical protein